ncbi:hypothetical protein D1872_328450 [compost metagenome]
MLGILLLHIGQQHRIAHPVRQVIHAAQLMCHRMNIAKTSIIERHTAKKYSIDQLLSGL